MRNFKDITCTLKADEHRLAQMLGDIWNEYLKLPVEHPCERDEFCKAIHACQDMILARPSVRAISREGEL